MVITSYKYLDIPNRTYQYFTTADPGKKVKDLVNRFTEYVQLSLSCYNFSNLELKEGKTNSELFNSDPGTVDFMEIL